MLTIKKIRINIKLNTKQYNILKYNIKEARNKKIGTYSRTHPGLPRGLGAEVKLEVRRQEVKLKVRRSGGRACSRCVVIL